MIYTLGTELSEREVYLIGSIVSQWGFLEDEIFSQTLLSFSDNESLPTPMNNAQFGAVLELWLERVVGRQEKAKRLVLKAQYDKIVFLNDYRQAVVHSRWKWRPDVPDEITAVRVHKKTIKSVKFTGDDLADFCSALGEVRFWVRYPGGIEDRVAEMAAAGGHISRLGYDLLAGRVTFEEISGLSTNKGNSER